MASSPHPVSVCPAALVQTKQLQTFAFSVRWSDGGETLVRRSWEEFRGLHKALKEAFPVEAGLLRRSDRVIPKLTDAPVLARGGRTGRGLERLRRLGTYSRELLAAERLSRSPALRAFFAPASQDLEPALPPGSLVTLPAPAENAVAPGPVGIPEAGSLRCLQPYSTEDAHGRPFHAAAGEALDVLLRQPSGWWLVANGEQQMAWFPAPYLEEWPKRGQSGGSGAPRFCISRAHTSSRADELSVPAGARVRVLETSERGWWLCRYGAQEGLLPAVLLRPDQLGALLSPQVLLHPEDKVVVEKQKPGTAPSVPARPSPSAVRRRCCTITRRALGKGGSDASSRPLGRAATGAAQGQLEPETPGF